MPTSRTIQHQYASGVTWSCIGHPDDPHKTLVNEEGALLYDYVNSIPAEGVYWFNKVFSFGLHSPHRQPLITQRTESARHPFVETRLEYPHATLTLLAFGHEQNSVRTDVVLWTIKCAKEYASVDTAVWVDGQALGKVFVLPKDDNPNPLYTDTSSQRVYMADAHQWQHLPSLFMVSDHHAKYSNSNGSATNLAYVSAPHPMTLAPAQHFGPVARMRTPILTVTSDMPAHGAFVFPISNTSRLDYTLEWAQQALADERRFWDDYAVQPFDWQIPDSDVRDMVTACARNILQAREVKDGLPEFQVGPTSYRGLWVVDGHFILEAARFLGHTNAGEQGINALLKRVQPDGAIMQLDFHPKETGISIYTLIRQCELSDDWGRLASVWSVIQNGVSYIRHLRDLSKVRGQDAPEYDLMPPAFADGGMGGNRPEYTTALWNLIGLKKAVEAAKRLRLTDDIERFTFEYEDLFRVFHEKAQRDMRTLPDGTPYLPIAMPNASSEHVQIVDYEGEVSPYYRMNPGTATWAFAQAIYPGELFTPDDPLVQNFCALLEQIDDEEGIPANTGWIPYNALWNYSASFNAHVWLYVGRPDKAIDYLYDFANHASPTRVWREEQSLRSATYEQLVGDMPHNWASAEFIRLTRNLLVFERLGRLELLMGLPPEWIQPNAVIRLETTPTRYGAVTLDLRFDEACQGTLHLTFDTRWSERPSQVILHVPHGFSVVQADAQKAVHADANTYILPFVNEQTLHLE